jgi:putative ABC transport system permease protein
MDREFAEELESHLQFDVEDGIRSGLSPEEARRQAKLRLGRIEPVKEAYRDRRSIPLLDSIVRDVCFAARMFRSQPGFTATVVFTLGIGIGATTAIFTVVNGVLVRPLPFPDPDRLVSITETLGDRPNPFTYTGDFAAFRDYNRSLGQIAGYMFFAANLTRGDLAERITGGLATRSFFELTGVQPVLGRNFLPDEDAPGGPAVVILSDSFWRTRCGANPSIIGQSLMLDGQSYEVVGVLPPSFRPPVFAGGQKDFSVWVPAAVAGKRAARGAIMLLAVGRLKSGVTPKQAAADLEPLQQVKLRNSMPKRVIVSNWQCEITRPVRSSLLILLSAVGFLLLISCVNVANLLLSRAATREKEMALRRAIGAGQARVLQQLLIESAILGLLGGALGLGLASLGKDILVAFLRSNLPALGPIGIDGRVLLFNLGIALVTGLTFGLAPAVQISELDLTRSLKDFARGSSESPSRRRLRGALVVLEVAVAMVLLCGAGLLIRSVLRLTGTDGGYNSRRILVMTFDLTESKYNNAASQAAFFRQALEKIEQAPGILSAGASTSPPLSLYRASLNEITLEGQSTMPTSVDFATISPNYFRTLGVPVIRGRDFTGADPEGTPSVVLVNESFSRRFFPKGDCIGKRVQNWAKDGDWMTIVGVVRDVRTYLEEEPPPEVYTPYLQSGGGHMTIVIRAGGEPVALMSILRSLLASVDKTQPPHDIGALDEALAEHFAPRRVKAALLGAFAALALALGAVGIYGVLSYSVKRRTHEIGVRLALGARGSEILRMIMKDGLGLVVSGVLIGIACGLSLAHLIASELWGISARDPWTFVIVAAVLSASGIAASLVPAVRATKVDPVLSLRYE